MQKTTIGAIIAGEVPYDEPSAFIYLFRDGGTIFYIGKSVDVYSRIEEHLGMQGRGYLRGGAKMEYIVNTNRPESLAWEVYLYTIVDCEVITGCQYNRESYGRDFAMEMAELDMIALHHPCLNTANNPHGTPLPARYIKVTGIANEGVKLKSA